MVDAEARALTVARRAAGISSVNGSCHDRTIDRG
jgi:hypothetical protein